jgi:hypothetical protein
LEAEAIRDAMLMVSGQLNLDAPRGSSVERIGEGIIGRNLKTENLGSEDRRRSVYLPIVRGAVPEMLALFDFPEPSIVGGARNVTTVPTQALYMMNNPGVIRSSEHLAKRIVAEATTPEERIALAYRLALARKAEPAEVERAIDFLHDTVRSLHEIEKRSSEESQTLAWTGICQALFASAEFRYLN